MLSAYVDHLRPYLVTFPSVPLLQLIILVLGGLFLAAAWRLWLDPLSIISGPRLAAISGLWQIWHDIVSDECLTQALPMLHQKYDSDVIRLSPNHIHVNDIEFYYRAHRVNSEFSRDEAFYDRIGLPGGILSMKDAHQHRILRAIINPLFSTRAVDQMAGNIYQKVLHASDLIAGKAQNSELLDPVNWFRSIVADDICTICYGYPMDDINSLLDSFDMLTRKAWIMIHIPYLVAVALKVPIGVVRLFLPGYAQFRQKCGEWVDRAVERKNVAISTSDNDMKTLFDLLLEPQDGKGYFPPTRESLISQAFTFVVAGVDTTSMILSFATYHILSSPDVLKNLQSELYENDKFIRDEFDWDTLRKLPYLSAVIRESVRLGCPTARIPRKVPPQGVYYKSNFIPGGVCEQHAHNIHGTRVSASAYTIHHDSTYFPEPGAFRPERWLQHDSHLLEKYSVAFSRGSHSCPGVHLAYLDIYVILAVLFSRFELQLESPTPEHGLVWSDQLAVMLKTPIKVNVLADRWNK